MLETLQENLLELICEKCSSDRVLNVHLGHITITLPDHESDFRKAYSKVKKEIMLCVSQHFPERNADVLFQVRNASWNCSFKIAKTT